MTNTGDYYPAVLTSLTPMEISYSVASAASESPDHQADSFTGIPWRGWHVDWESHDLRDYCVPAAACGLDRKWWKCLAVVGHAILWSQLEMGAEEVKILRVILAWLHARIHAARFAAAKRRASRGSRWDRLPRAARRQVAIRSGVSAGLADTWAAIRYRDLPEGWKEKLLENSPCY